MSLEVLDGWRGVHIEASPPAFTLLAANRPNQVCCPLESRRTCVYGGGGMGMIAHGQRMCIAGCTTLLRTDHVACVSLRHLTC
jgi:hypothetical protein